MKKIQRTSFNKAFLEKKKTSEDQVVALSKFLEEAKTGWDQVVAVSRSMKFEQERLSWVAKEEAEKRSKAEAKRDTIIEAKDVAVKALEEEKVDREVEEERIRKEAYEATTQEILNYEIGFTCSFFFMIREKHLDLDLSGIDFIDMKGYDKLDPVDGSKRLGD